MPRLRPLPLLLLWVCNGCSRGDAAADGKGGAGGDDGVSACPGVGFGAGETWALPDELPSATYDAGGSGDCGGSSSWYYSTFDLTGDGLPDLVMTHTECGDAQIGEAYWKVFPGGADGFGSGEEWALPDRLPSATFNASGTADCGESSSWYHSTFDLTGDGIPDFVMTQNECGDGEIGSSYWKVFPGGSSGFGAAERWALPAGLPSATYDVGGSATCGGMDFWYYSTFDLTGDHLPDLVMTQNECGDDAIGTSYWRVFPGECE
jgi:hypothetical protein